MITTVEITQRETWDSLPHTNWQHSWEFGVVQESNNRSILRISIEENNELVGYAQVIAYDLYRDKTIVYCPYGPVWLRNPSPEAWSALAEQLKQFGADHNAIAVRIETDNVPSGFVSVGGFMYHASFHAPRGEMILEIDKPLSELAEHFHKKTAYNIRKAAKNGLFTKVYSGKDMLSQLDFFIELNKANMASHNTTTHADEYFKTLFGVLAENPDNFIIVSYSGLEEIQAINVFTVWGEGQNKQCHCPFGASNREGKKSGAYYFIKQEAIKHLQTIRVTKFNWGGVAIGIHDESLTGLNQFKQGFGGEIITHKRFADLVISTSWYLLYKLRAYLKRV